MDSRQIPLVLVERLQDLWFVAPVSTCVFLSAISSPQRQRGLSLRVIGYRAAWSGCPSNSAAPAPPAADRRGFRLRPPSPDRATARRRRVESAWLPAPAS